MSGRNRLIAIFCLALSMSLVGSYVALSKPLTVALPVFLLAWLRFGIGGLAMTRWLKKPANEPTMTLQTKKLVFLESFLGNFMFSIFMLFGVSMTSVSGRAYGQRWRLVRLVSRFIHYQNQSILLNIYAGLVLIFG